MKRFLLVLASVLSAAGFIIASLSGGDNSAGVAGLILPDNIPALITERSEEGLGPNKYIKAHISGITDGDTVKAEYKGTVYKVRLLCVDTPESKKTGVEEQAYAEEAARLTEKLVLDKNVRLVFDKGLKDRYGRLLAYVVLEDGSCLNSILVRNGYARAELVSPNTKHRDYFHKLQAEAIRGKAGMWGLDPSVQPFVKSGKGNYIPRHEELDEVS